MSILIGCNAGGHAMKTHKQIMQEIEFHEKEYDRLKALTETGITNAQKDEYRRVMSRHAARRQALLWVIEN